MSSEPTEMAGVAEAETQAAYAWALDDGVDDLPTQRLTSRRITALGIAASLTVIAAAGAVALTVVRQPEPASASAPAAPAAVLDGTYRLDFTSDPIMGMPNPPLPGQPAPPQTAWRAFRSTCTPAGCTAMSTVLDDANHQTAFTPLTTHQWRFTDGRWVMLPEKSRVTRDRCTVEDDKTVAGDETVLGTTSLEPQPGGSLRGLSTATAISSECGQEGSVQQSSFTMTRVGDVPPGVSVPDPSTVSVQLPSPVAPVAGPVLDGTYRLDYDHLAATESDSRMRNTSTRNEADWWAIQSVCVATGCAATAATLDDVNHQEPDGGGRVLNFDGHQWLNTSAPMRIDVTFTKGDDRVKLTCGPQQTVVLALTLTPQPDGTLKGIQTLTYESNECGFEGLVTTIPVTATRTGPVSPNVVLADPALFV